MTKKADRPSWSRQSGRASQREFRRANGRARSLRRNMTPSERRLWTALRMPNREGFHFRRQPAVGPWVFDFGDLSARVLVELDGGVHERLADVAARDIEKTERADADGFLVLRFSSESVRDAPDEVVSVIRSAASLGAASRVRMSAKKE